MLIRSFAITSSFRKNKREVPSRPRKSQNLALALEHSTVVLDVYWFMTHSAQQAKARAIYIVKLSRLSNAPILLIITIVMRTMDPFDYLHYFTLYVLCFLLWLVEHSVCHEPNSLKYVHIYAMQIALAKSQLTISHTCLPCLPSTWVSPVPLYNWANGGYFDVSSCMVSIYFYGELILCFKMGREFWDKVMLHCFREVKYKQSFTTGIRLWDMFRFIVLSIYQ